MAGRCVIFAAVMAAAALSASGCGALRNQDGRTMGKQDGQALESQDGQILEHQDGQALENQDGQTLEHQDGQAPENQDGQTSVESGGAGGAGADRESAAGSGPDGESGDGRRPGLDKEAEEIILPSRFDYREQGKLPLAGDQGDLGTCWAFSSLMAMESTLLPEESWDFSEDHMSRMNSFSLAQEEGGQYAMSMAYLLAWQGPVREEDDAYGDGYSPEGLEPVKHVQEIRILEEKDYDRIKRAVYETGGVQSSLYTTLQNVESTDPYYSRETCGYYYPGEEKPNHNVVIVGWDDDYPRENFTEQPQGDGAFICLNSWGQQFGEEGCFYVSYYDTNIGAVNVLYSGITDPDVYTGIYQSDLCGWIGQLGYGQADAWFSNAYQAAGDEMLTAVGFYATMPDTRYTVYAQTGGQGPEELMLSEPLASGSFTDAGFYTVPLSQEIPLKSGEKFWITVQIHTPGAIHPVAIEYQAPDMGGKVDLSDGEGYLSQDGKTWVSAEQTQKANLCLKAYTVK